MQTQEHTQDPANNRSWEETRLDATGSVLEDEDYTPSEQGSGSMSQSGNWQSGSGQSGSGQSGSGQAALGEAKSKAKQLVTETMDEATGQVKSTFSEQKVRAADQLNTVASALRQAGNELQNSEQQSFAQYAEAAADQVERLSTYIKEREFGELWADLQATAKRQPELFVAGALAAGFLVGRFLKSSGNQSSRNYGSGARYYDSYGGQSAGYGSNYGASYGSNYGSTSGANWSGQQSSGSQDIPITQTGGQQYGGQW
jgi:hypothetical protein